MDSAEAAEVGNWIKNFQNTLRMEYGQAMALAGFSEDVIIDVQNTVARNMIVWLARR